MSSATVRSVVMGCVLSLVLLACKKEAPLSPGAPDVLYKLPQGNHPYDTAIQNFYNKYHCFILYKWDSTEFLYAVTRNFTDAVMAYAADSDYVQQALDFMHANWFDLYPSAFLQQTLPLKILLASDIDTVKSAQGITIHHVFPSSVAGYNHVTFGLVNGSLPTLTTGERDTARGCLQRAYWLQALGMNMVEAPPAFDSTIQLSQVTNTPVSLQQNGIVRWENPLTITMDLADWVMVITSTNSATMNSTWLSPSNDIYGAYKKKYDIITSYYLNKYGVDLQAIGNLP